MRAEPPPRTLDYQLSIAFHSSMQRGGKLEFLQVLRLFAAGLVLLHHSAGDAIFAHQRTSWIFSHADLGSVGVLIFFVLSGYVIALQIGKPPLRFAWHRLLRIYPAYIVAALVGIIVFKIVSPSTPVHFDWSMLLLPVGQIHQEWVLVPYWTLIYEMMFYTLAFLAIACGRRAFDFMLIVWALLIVTYTLPDPPMQASINIVRAPLCLFFIGGAVLCRLHQGASAPAIGVLLAVCSMLFWRDFPASRVVMFGIAIVVVVHIAVKLSERFTAPRILVLGGDWSYGLYLLHIPVLRAVGKAFPIASMPEWLSILVLVVVAGATAAAFGCGEYAFYKWAKARLETNQQRRAGGNAIEAESIPAPTATA